MIVAPIKTRKVLPNAISLFELVDIALPKIQEGSIVAITSKVVSLCEGRVVPIGHVDKDTLIQEEADYYLPPELSQYRWNFALIRNTLIASAGIDQSNSSGNYVL